MEAGGKVQNLGFLRRLVHLKRVKATPKSYMVYQDNVALEFLWLEKAIYLLVLSDYPKKGNRIPILLFTRSLNTLS